MRQVENLLLSKKALNGAVIQGRKKGKSYFEAF